MGDLWLNLGDQLAHNTAGDVTCDLIDEWSESDRRGMVGLVRDCAHYDHWHAVLVADLRHRRALHLDTQRRRQSLLLQTLLQREKCRRVRDELIAAHDQPGMHPRRSSDRKRTQCLRRHVAAELCVQIDLRRLARERDESGCGLEGDMVEE